MKKMWVKLIFDVDEKTSRFYKLNSSKWKENLNASDGKKN